MFKLNWNSDNECFIGPLKISIVISRMYKDGTGLYLIYLRVPDACSREIIIIDKIRGTIDDAKYSAENFLKDIIK